MSTTDFPPVSASHDPKFDLIASEYETARLHADRLRRRIPMLLVVLLTVNALYIILATRSFFHSEFDTFSRQFTANMAVVLDRHMPRLRHAANRLIPVYGGTFKRTADERLPELRIAIVDELSSVEKSGQDRLPAFRQEIEALMQRQALGFITHVERAIGRPLSRDESVVILGAYGREMRRRAEEVYYEGLSEQREVLADIGRNLDSLARTEPDLVDNIQPEHATGVLLEFLGVEMQSGRLSSIGAE